MQTGNNGKPPKPSAAQEIKAPQQIVFIPAEKLGVMETLVRNLPLEATKRKRQIEFNRLEHVLKGLKLVAWSDRILSISFGCLRSGLPGMMVSFQTHNEHMTQQIVDIPRKD